MKNWKRNLLFAAVSTATIAFTASSVSAAIIATDDFSSYTAGQEINFGGASANWNQKWQSDNMATPEDESTQQNLIRGDGAGTANFNTSAAWRNYRALHQTGFSITGTETAVISTDFRYSHASGGNITANLNSNFFGLLISDQPQWWSGANKSMSVANRGGAIGNSLPMVPWIQNWISHSSVGIDTSTGGTSDWLAVEMGLSVNGAGRYQGVLTFKDSSGMTLGMPSAVVDLGIAAGTTIYAGYTTDWNSVGNVPISTVNSITNVGVDNFSIETFAVPEPASLVLLGLGGLALFVRRRRSV